MVESKATVKATPWKNNDSGIIGQSLPDVKSSPARWAMPGGYSQFLRLLAVVNGPISVKSNAGRKTLAHNRAMSYTIETNSAAWSHTYTLSFSRHKVQFP